MYIKYIFNYLIYLYIFRHPEKGINTTIFEAIGGNFPTISGNFPTIGGRNPKMGGNFPKVKVEDFRIKRWKLSEMISKDII